MSRKTFYFSDGPYLQAMHGLHTALSGSEAFVKFIGHARTGKSGVCEKLTQFMRHKGYQVIYFDYPIESPDMLRSILAKELDVPDSFNMLRHLEDALLDESGKPLILLFDDAHELSDITLIEIYRLAGVQVNQKRVINMVLCGEPELERRLSNKKEFQPLLQHISHNFLLDAMSAETTSQFLQAFLEKMELPTLQLEPAAQHQFFKSCRGFPGPAYSLCQLVLSIHQRSPELNPISKEELQRAIRSADSEEPVSSGLNRQGSRRMLVAPIAAVLVIASLALLMRQLSPAEDEVAVAVAGSASNAIDSSVEPVANESDLSPFADDELSTANTNRVSSPGNEEDASELVSLQANTSAIVSAPVLVEQPEIPEVPVSDSDLALVTAEERGISQDTIAEPEFEPLTSVDPLADAIAAPVLSVVDESIIGEAAVEDSARVEPTVAESIELNDVIQVANVSLTRPMLALDDEAIEEPAPIPVDRPEPLIEPISEETSAQAAEELPATIAAQSMVQRWLDAWEGQDLVRYFASYDDDFVPRYHRSKSAWRSNRERVIGNAREITLELSDFELIFEDAQTVEVHFWLAYRSPTYRDDTRKKLVLRKLPAAAGSAGQKLLILEEVNLEVRV